jgi:hypothetical protein
LAQHGGNTSTRQEIHGQSQYDQQDSGDNNYRLTHGVIVAGSISADQGGGKRRAVI